MDAKHKAKWERFRRRGKRKLILLVTLASVAGNLVLYPIMSVALFDEPFGTGILVRAAIIGLIGGPILGLSFWNSNERAYQDATSRE